MNTILTYIKANRQRLELDRYGLTDHFSVVWLTPQFRASSHIICFILTEELPDPILVIKIPRLKGDNERLDCEAYNLQQIQASRTEGYESIPRVIAYEEWMGNRLLIETALKGEPMKPVLVRRHLNSCIESVMAWLLNLKGTMCNAHETDPLWFDRLVLQPLKYLEFKLSDCLEDRAITARLLGLMQSLEVADFPLAFEHGDLGSPNILVGREWDIGVVDWELAEPRGVPAGDLFFFLSYIAFARGRASKSSAYIRAFDKAFFGQAAWTKPWLTRYSQEFGISRALLKPLFILYWSRYLAKLIKRLNRSDTTALSGETLQWLQSNRYYLLWKYAFLHLDRLGF